MTNEQRMVPADELRVRAEVSGSAVPSDSQGPFDKSRLKWLVTQVFGEGYQIMPPVEPVAKCGVCHGDPDMCDIHDCGDAHKQPPASKPEWKKQVDRAQSEVAAWPDSVKAATKLPSDLQPASKENEE